MYCFESATVLVMLAHFGLLSYRILCLLGYGYTAYFIFRTRPPTVSLVTNINLQTRFLTVDTLLVQVLYYALAILLMPTKFHVMKSVLACFALTTSTVVSIMFWGLYFYDRSVIMTEESFDKMPIWLMHVTHSFVSATAVFDILISRPKSVSFAKSLLLVFFYFLSYAVYTEYLIYKEKFFVYPLMEMFSTVGRYQFYLVVLVGVLLVFLVSVLVIKFSSVETKRKQKKDKFKGKKSQNQDHQQDPQKSVSNSNVKKKKKQSKRD